MTNVPSQPHPFIEAWRARDPAAWGQHLAEDIEVHSPLLRTPIRGRQTVQDLYADLFVRFGEISVTQFHGDEAEAFLWRGELEGRYLQGADFVQLDSAGQVSQITVMIRPLPGLGHFAAAVAPPFARRRGRLQLAVIRMLLPAIPTVARRRRRPRHTALTAPSRPVMRGGYPGFPSVEQSSTSLRTHGLSVCSNALLPIAKRRLFAPR